MLSMLHFFAVITELELQLLIKIYETPVESEIDLVGRLYSGRCKTHCGGVFFYRVREPLLRRYQTCIDVQGRHFEQLL